VKGGRLLRGGWPEGADPQDTIADTGPARTRLGSHELFQRSGPIQAGVWDKMMRGLSTRNYGAVVKDFHDAYGIEKSTVSENFIEASREKVQELMERPLGELRLFAVLIDGTPFKDRQMIVALGIGCDGSKTVLGLREGTTENAAVVNGLLSELVERRLDFSTPRLYILMAAKRCTRGCGVTPAKRRSSSVARCTRSATLRRGKTLPYRDSGTSLCGADPEIQERTRSTACSCSGGRFAGRRCAMHHLGCPSSYRERKSERCRRKGLRSFAVAFLNSHYALPSRSTEESLLSGSYPSWARSRRS